MCDCIDGWVDLTDDGPTYCENCRTGLEDAIGFWSTKITAINTVAHSMSHRQTLALWQRRWLESVQDMLTKAEAERLRLRFKLEQLERDTALPIQYPRGRAVLFKT